MRTSPRVNGNNDEKKLWWLKVTTPVRKHQPVHMQRFEGEGLGGAVPTANETVSAAWFIGTVSVHSQLLHLRVRSPT